MPAKEAVLGRLVIQAALIANMEHGTNRYSWVDGEISPSKISTAEAAA